MESAEKVITGFSHAGIGVQIMGFTGFPSETYAEAMDSIEFLNRMRAHWVFGGLGEFQLTAGSMIAKEPERFGITHLRTAFG